MLTFGDIPHHAPVLLAWALLRHTLNPEETSSVVRKIGGTAIQLNVFQYLTRLLQSLASGGNDVSLRLWVVSMGVSWQKHFNNVIVIMVVWIMGSCCNLLRAFRHHQTLFEMFVNIILLNPYNTSLC